MNYYLGVDVGHTKIKAGIVNSQGNVVYVTSHKTPFDSETIEADVLWQCVAKCIKKLISESTVSSADIKAITCSGHGNGLYLLDKDNVPFKYAYSATYNAGKKIVDSLINSKKADEIKKYTLQDIWAGQPLPILAYLKEEKPELYAQIGTAFFCKDYINYCLTGKIFTDYTDASAAGVINNLTGEYDARIFELLGLNDKKEIFPNLKRSFELVGYVSKSAAQLTGLAEGTPVASGMFDVAASLVGSGVYKSDICSVISGTWGINSVISDKIPDNQKFLQCTRFIDGEKFLYIESAPTSSVNLEWLLKNIFTDKDYRDADVIAEKYSASDVSIIYMPYIYGDVRGGAGGAFYNISVEDTYKTMIRAVYEGVAFGHRKQLEKLADSGALYDKIIFSGGATKSDIWCRIFSDVLGQVLYVPKFSDTGILGDAIIGSLAVGDFDNIEDACNMAMPEYRIYYPNAENVVIYNEKYKIFKKHSERRD